MARRPWVGFDLDGTLAVDVPSGPFDFSVIGEPIEAAVRLLKDYLNQGYEVRIVTARASIVDYETIFDGTVAEFLAAVKAPIEAWCQKHIGCVLPITSEKDYNMVLLFDDRARQVIRNTGQVVEAA